MKTTASQRKAMMRRLLRKEGWARKWPRVVLVESGGCGSRTSAVWSSCERWLRRESGSWSESIRMA